MSLYRLNCVDAKMMMPKYLKAICQFDKKSKGHIEVLNAKCQDTIPRWFKMMMLKC